MSDPSSSTQPQVEQPPENPYAHIQIFARGVVNLLTTWPALRLAVQHNVSGTGRHEESPEDKRRRLAEEVVEMFVEGWDYESVVGGGGGGVNGETGEETEEYPHQEDLEDHLYNFMGKEFHLRLEDESDVSVARDIRVMWKESIERTWGGSGSGQGSGGLLERMERLAENARREDEGRPRIRRKTEGDEDEDEDDDSSEGEEEGGKQGNGGVGTSDAMDVDADVDVDEPEGSGRRSRAEPEVDEDGFATVVRSKKGRR